MLDRLIAVLAPHYCVGCASKGTLLCEFCKADTRGLLPDRCYLCLASSKDSCVCAVCRKQTPLSHVWVYAQHDGIIKKLLEAYKYERGQSAATLVAELLGDTCPALPKNTVVTCIPTATSRVRQRGYDHVRNIATAFAKQRGFTVLVLLERRGQARQVGSTRAQRKEQAKRSYVLKKNTNLRGKNILLIDDVLTTGATLEAAARLLRSAGAKQVDGLVLASRPPK